MSIDPHPCACMGEAPAVDAEHLREFLAEQRSALHREFSFAQQRLSFRHFEIMRGHGIPAAQLVADGRIGVVKANVERDDFWSPDEGGKSMIVTPVVEDGRTIDLVAFLLSDPDAWYLRTGDGWALGAEAVADAATAWDSEGGQMHLHPTPVEWLRSGGAGACVIRWTDEARATLRNVPAISVASPVVARKLRLELARPPRLPEITVRGRRLYAA
ncbi:MAG: hypothetical protein ACTHMG_04840 [Sphingomonas sp.]